MMTLDEFIVEIEECEAAWKEKPLPGVPRFNVVVKGYREGNRCKIAKGLTGDFVCHLDGNQTQVSVKASDARKYVMTQLLKALSGKSK